MRTSCGLVSPPTTLYCSAGARDTSAKLLRQAALFETRYTYGGQRARGISFFAASSAVDELAVLESKLRTFPKYRRVRGAELAEIAVLPPTFQALLGPSCSGRLVEPVGRRKSC